MSFVVVQAQQVNLAVSDLSDAMRYQFRQIVSLLASNPYPSDDFSPIEARTGTDGREYYQYFDGIVPLVLQYRVYAHDAVSNEGMVWLARAIPLNELEPL